MKLQDLTEYAKTKYRIKEQYKWKEHPGFSVLVHPKTEKWIALLMRKPDIYTGGNSESCDLKVGRENKLGAAGTCTFTAQRMRGSDWINIPFNALTKCGTVYELFDKAVEFCGKEAAPIVISREPVSDPETGGYQDTEIPHSGGGYRASGAGAPERIRRMRALYKYTRKSSNEEAKYFYLQAKYMEDYEDDAPWDMVKDYIYPCYQDLTTKELRGYFSWRSAVRKGIYKPIGGNLELIYISELLNGVGAETPEECLQKLDEFQASYLEKDMGNKKTLWKLRDWKLQYAIINNVSPEIAIKYFDPYTAKYEHTIEMLEKPGDYSDEDIYKAITERRMKNNVHQFAAAKYPEKCMHIIAEAWRMAVADRFGDEKLFSSMFKERRQTNWYPLSGAVYYDRGRAVNADYYLNSNHSYHARNGQWTESTYRNSFLDQNMLQSFARRCELMLRKYLKIGKTLHEREDEQWAGPYIERAIEADRLAEAEARRPKILEDLDLKGLEKIRRDASKTRDSLIIEDMEDAEDMKEVMEVPETTPEEEPGIDEASLDLPLSSIQFRIIRALLDGETAGDIINDNNLMPSIVADGINEALYDEFGDVVILCEDDRLEIVEDYEEDLGELIYDRK